MAHHMDAVAAKRREVVAFKADCSLKYSPNGTKF